MKKLNPDLSSALVRLLKPKEKWLYFKRNLYWFLSNFLNSKIVKFYKLNLKKQVINCAIKNHLDKHFQMPK